jgi:hypothetical protein
MELPAIDNLDTKKKKRLSFMNALKSSKSSSLEGTSPPGGTKAKASKKEEKHKQKSQDIGLQDQSQAFEHTIKVSESPGMSPTSTRSIIEKSLPLEEDGAFPTAPSQVGTAPCSEDIYHSLPSLKVLQLRDAAVLASLTGPDDVESEALFDWPLTGELNQKVNVAACQASSTYPHLPGKPTRVCASATVCFTYNFLQEGDPICDVFHVKLLCDRAIIGLADGCNWGHRPREAAVRATKALAQYLEDHQSDIQDVKDAGHFLLRAFDKASREIVLGKDDIWEAGTTTLLGALLMQLAPTTSLSSEIPGNPPKWCVVCASVGDCKVCFHNWEWTFDWMFVFC